MFGLRHTTQESHLAYATHGPAERIEWDRYCRNLLRLRIGLASMLAVGFENK